MVERLTTIHSFIEGMDLQAFVEDYKTQLAVTRLVEELCEAALWFAKNDNGVEIAARNVDVNWRRFGDAGNIIRHQYARVDYVTLWRNLWGPDVGALEDALEREVPFYKPLFRKAEQKETPDASSAAD